MVVKRERALRGATTMQIIRSAAVALTATLLLVAAGQPSEAQAFNPFGWFQQVFRPPPRSYQEYAPPRSHPRYVYHPRAIAKAPPKPAVPPSFFVAVIGDSLGQELGQGLATALSDRPEVAVLHEAKEDSGLVRNDFYDWPKVAHDLVTSGQKINVAVMMVGSNDHQTLHDSTGSYDPGTPQYQQIYAARIEAVAKAFHDAKIPLIWVGLPIMKSDRFSGEMTALNDFYRQYASKNGATYIDTWDDFVDDSGAFSSYGPDVDGQVVRLRALDGIHFTKAGALKLASFVESQIRELLDGATPQDDAALAKIETTAPAGTNSPASNAAVAPQKPAIGPVLPLTGPALAPGGQLATLTSNGSKADTANLVEKTFVNGKPPPPTPGRADDFSWPRAELASKPANPAKTLVGAPAAAAATPAKAPAASPASASH